MTIGKRIAKKRKAQKLTQAALAGAVGVSTAFVSQIEGGSRNPSYGLMIKIAHELQASIESLLSGESTTSSDPLDKLLHAITPFLDTDKKKKVIDYIFLLSGSKHYRETPFFSSPTEYAQFFIQELNIKDTPVDVFQIAENFGVKFVRAELKDCEAILYKNPDTPLILLDSNNPHQEREKFTVAIMLGHLLIPWHLKHTFYRSEDKRSLDNEDKLEIEARQFAGELMLPGLLVKNDFKKIDPSIEIFEKFAREKYRCSMTALAHKYSEHYGSRAVYITSDKTAFTRTYDKGFPYKLVDDVTEGSIAYSFIVDPPTSKESRSGVVEGSIWFKDIPAGIKVVEESMLDPRFGITVTLLQLEHK
ncbi:MAG: helix-turn-helix domain-containing protein [Proteobacteria bacterium]|nr:helix-turn-helix domain-containing protein [Pseudomonadota bacterium]